ncbi:MAG: SRPBCC family protein [Nocardioidaceae bacterium]|nr:SRPBCC family protein [Nocardioidaceae bacterium]MCL2614581.1 SRPBCC family protein [Nocardioidaceae bacterium]
MAGHIIYTHSTIPAPPEAVWDVITDVTHAGEVFRSVSDAGDMSPGDFAVGSAWHERHDVFGHHDMEEMHVVECEQPRRAVVEAKAGADTIRTSYRLTPADERHASTRLAMTTFIEMKDRSTMSRAMWKVFGNLSFGHTRKVLEHDLEDIEAEAVRRSVPA